MTNYVLCIPDGGFNDQLSQIELCYHYCKLFNRVLLIDTLNSTYRISFHTFFYFSDSEVKLICDSSAIKKIVDDNKYSINQGSNINNYGRSFLTFQSFSGYDHNFKNEKDYKETILVHRGCGKGYPKTIINLLQFNDVIKDEFKTRFDKLEKPYLCIYVRNTDRQSNFKELYETHKDVIKQYKSIYIATDNKNVLTFFKTKCLCQNFTTFGKCVRPLHTDNSVNKNTKVIDLICDMLIIGLSEKLITNSGGGFTRLVNYLNDNKHIINEKLVK